MDTSGSLSVQSRAVKSAHRPPSRLSALAAGQVNCQIRPDGSNPVGPPRPGCALRHRLGDDCPKPAMLRRRHERALTLGPIHSERVAVGPVLSGAGGKFVESESDGLGGSRIQSGVRHSPRPPKRGQRLRRCLETAFAVAGGDAVGPSFSTITPCQMNICRQT
jgi:hypothetical protein